MMLTAIRNQFVSHFLLAIATASVVVASPLEMSEASANEGDEPNPNTEIPEEVRSVTVRIEVGKILKLQEGQGSEDKELINCPGTNTKNCFISDISNGTGTIIAVDDSSSEYKKYTVLTADHNFYRDNQFIFNYCTESVSEERNCSELKYPIAGYRATLITQEIQAEGRQENTQEHTYELNQDNITRLRKDERYGLDLAIVTFESAREYPIATLAPLPPGIEPSTARNGSTVRVTGWPNSDVQQGSPVLWYNEGTINPHQEYNYLGVLYDREGNVLTKPPKTNGDNDVVVVGNVHEVGGYVMGYNAETTEGVSGGPVFDESGNLIGVHGRGQNRSQPADPGDESRKIIGENVSGGIPINTFTDQLPGSPNRPSDYNTLFDHPSLNGLLKEIRRRIAQGSGNPGDEPTPPESVTPNPIDRHFQQAAEYWRNALAAAVDNGGCQGECEQEAKKALEEYNQALEKIGGNPSRVRARALVLRAIVHQLLGNSSKKESDWEEASQIVESQADPLAYVWLGNTLYRWGDRQKAEEFWDEAINRASSESADVYLEIGQFLMQNGAPREGREYWNRLIDNLPENSVIRREIADSYAYFARRGYGQTYEDIDFDEEALRNANEAVRLAPDNPYALYDRSKIKHELGDTEGAREDLREAKESCEESICGTLIADLGTQVGMPPEPEPPPRPPEPAPQQPFNPPSDDQPPSEIATGPTYLCEQQEEIPQTRHRDNIQPLITWQSREFGSQYQPLERCNFVSNRLESYHSQGLLAQIDRITYGEMNNYRVLCIAPTQAAAEANNCAGGELIVTLGSATSGSIEITTKQAQDILEAFKDALQNPTSYEGPIDAIKELKGMPKPEESLIESRR